MEGYYAAAPRLAVLIGRSAVLRRLSLWLVVRPAVWAARRSTPKWDSETRR